MSKPAYDPRQAKLRQEYLELIAREEKNPEKWIPYYDKHAGHFAKLSNGGIFVIERPRICTDFCFGESGYDYDDAHSAAQHARTDPEYFKAENLRNFSEWIEVLECGTWRGGPARVFSSLTGKNFIWLEIRRPNQERYSTGTPITDEDRITLLHAYRAAHAALEKRLDTYLKRYGLSKLHVWTYWRDA